MPHKVVTCADSFGLAWGADRAAGRVYDLRGSAPGAGLPRQSAANWAGTSNIPKRCGTFQIYGATCVFVLRSNGSWKQYILYAPTTRRPFHSVHYSTEPMESDWASAGYNSLPS